MLYHQYSVENMKSDLEAIIASNTLEINNVKSLLLEKVKGLEVKDLELVENTQKIEKSLESSIADSSKKLKALSSEISSVKEESEENIDSLEKSISSIKVSAADFSEIIDDSISSVVSVQTNVGVGSGFIVDSDGFIVTNKHVIEDATAALILTSDGVQHSVTIVGFAKNSDIAVLSIDKKNLNSLQWADSDDINVGEKAIAIGNPGGLDFSVSQGIVSSTDREDVKGNQLIQIDVPINPGNSGGPLINTQGKVMGVNTLKLAGFDNVGFALASNDVRKVVKKIIDG
tara:strand:- start:8999 stop:9859 length:861 start_codon:yes stop_codon:yes gene_type:complete